jgi:hypothetical protein
MRRLPEEKRHFFRKPFGRLTPDIRELLPDLAGRKVYTVGDIVTRRSLELGVTPEVAVIDGHTMRLPCGGIPGAFPRTIHARNPPGTITDELIQALQEALAGPPALVVVEGEEDLAVIPLVMAAPEGGVVLYGQPGEGVVLRVVDAGAVRKARELFSCFEEAVKPEYPQNGRSDRQGARL